MTRLSLKAKNFYNWKNGFLTFVLFAASFSASLLLSERIAHSVRSSLYLCANVIVPAVFPFMIISDIIRCWTAPSYFGRLGVLFEKLFKINRNGLYPFMLGLICGFPLGVKSATELYKSGLLSKDEAERIIGFCNNTGPAFLISGIGAGLRKNAFEGLILYISMALSAVLLGIIFGIGKKVESAKITYKTESFSFTESIKSAGLGTLFICSFVTFFSTAVGLLRGAIGESYTYLMIIPFIEVGSATSILSKTKLITKKLSLTLTSFAVGFSGLSVHLQSLSYINTTDLSTKRYFMIKLFEGILCMTLTYLVNTVFTIK